MNQISEHRLNTKNRENDLPMAKKYPRLFLWQRGTLIVSILICVAIVIDTAILYYIESNPQPKYNYTYLNSIIQKSTILKTKQDYLNLINTMKKGYPSIRYQLGAVISIGQLVNITNNITFDQINRNVFNRGNKNLLYIIELRNESETKKIISLYLHNQFAVPQGDNYDDNLQYYYTFQSKQQQKSMIITDNLNLNLLKINTTNSINHCHTYSLNKTHLILLNTLSIQFNQLNNTNILVSQFPQCFGLDSSNIQQYVYKTFWFPNQTWNIQAIEVFQLLE